MKNIITIVVMSALWALTCAGMQPRTLPPNEDVQSTLEEGVPTTPTPALAPVAAPAAPPAPATAPVAAAVAQANEQLARADDQLAQANAELAQAEAAAAARAADQAETMSGLTTTLSHMAHRGRGAGNALVIRSADFDPKEQSSLEEDLTVMSHILDKALEEKVSGQPRARKAMGIDVVFSSSSTPVRSLYLEGYGAVFFLNVGFPLLAPPKAEPKKEPVETSSTWEEARQELYGQPGQPKMPAPQGEEYDQDKVDKLKDSVLDALKNGSNIRDLKADDSITVCVFGGAGRSVRPQSAVRRTPAPTAVENYVYVFGDSKTGRTRGTILTIRVRKADADAFAKGKLDLDGLRKKAKVSAYSGNGVAEGWNSFGSFGSGGGYGVWQSR
jgi:hypothetical protein